MPVFASLVSPKQVYMTTVWYLSHPNRDRRLRKNKLPEPNPEQLVATMQPQALQTSIGRDGSQPQTISQQCQYNNILHASAIRNMSQLFTSLRLQRLIDHGKSASSSDQSGRNNKERMKEFKTLTIQKNSVMEHLLSSRKDRPSKDQVLNEFHSEKWNLGQISIRRQKNPLGGSCILPSENPFHRAKQNYLNREQITASSEKSQKDLLEPQVDFEMMKTKTTFKMLSQDSLNERLSWSALKSL